MNPIPPFSRTLIYYLSPLCVLSSFCKLVLYLYYETYFTHLRNKGTHISNPGIFIYNLFPIIKSFIQLIVTEHILNILQVTGHKVVNKISKSPVFIVLSTGSEQITHMSHIISKSIRYSKKNIIGRPNLDQEVMKTWRK